MGNVVVGTLRVNLTANTASFESDLGKAGGTARRSAQEMKDSFDKVDFHEAKGGLMLLEESLGTRLPRHVNSFLATLPGVGAAMSAAFPVLAVVVLGEKLFEAYEHMSKLTEKTEEASNKYANMVSQINRHAEAIDIDNLKIRDQISILNKGIAHNALKIAFEEARGKAEELTSQIEKAIAEEKKLLETQSHGFWAGLMGDTKTDDIVDFILKSKAAIGDLEHEKGMALTAHQDALVKSLQVEIDAKNVAMRKEIDTRVAAEDVARKEKINKDLAAANSAHTNERAAASSFGNKISPAENAKAELAYLAQINEHQDKINAASAQRVKLYTLAKLELQGEEHAEKSLAENANLHIEEAGAKEKATREKNEKEAEDFFNKARERDVKRGAEKKKLAEEDAAALRKGFELTEQWNHKLGVDEENNYDKMQKRADEMASLVHAAAVEQAEHNIRLMEASGIITKIEADRQLMALADVDEKKQLDDINAGLKLKEATLIRTAAETQGGMSSDPAQQARYQRALKEYQEFLIKKEKLELAHNKKVDTLAEDEAKRLREIQKKTIDGVTNMLNTGVQSWITGQESFGQAAMKAWQGMATSAVMSLIKVGEERLTQHMLGEEMDDQDKLKDASASARKVFRSVMDSVPFPLNVVLGPVAAAGAFTAAMAFKGGGDVPGYGDEGVPSLLHPKEMVLDAGLADVVRGAARNSGGHGGAGHQQPLVYAPVIHGNADEAKLNAHFDRWAAARSRKHGMRMP